MVLDGDDEKSVKVREENLEELSEVCVTAMHADPVVACSDTPAYIAPLVLCI